MPTQKLLYDDVDNMHDYIRSGHLSCSCLDISIIIDHYDNLT